MHDSYDDEAGYNSMVCVEEEVKVAQGISDVEYLDNGTRVQDSIVYHTEDEGE